MTIKVNSIQPFAYTAQGITVEADSTRGLPNFEIIGHVNHIITESKSRIRSAITNSGFSFPVAHLIINLAPAEIPKRSSHLDLPIAVAILALSHQLLPTDISQCIFVGELALNGEIRPVHGIINILEYASKHNFKAIYIPAANANEAKLFAHRTKTKIYPVETLQALWLQLKNIRKIQHLSKNVKITETETNLTNPPITFDQICGQENVKRALTIAIAGHHNILMIGPPGSGKTALARAAAELLPPLSLDELLDTTKVYSLTNTRPSITLKRPFRAPHHESTPTAIIGGGTKLLPGEISLAHHGVLFLDEFPEFSRQTLEPLRQPLEEKRITLAHATERATYPADFMLIAAMNPCPCGNYGSKKLKCTCTPYQRQLYQKRISGPLLDRIDLFVHVPRLSTTVLLKSTTLGNSESESAKTQISTALAAQKQRFGKDSTFNANLSSVEASKLITRSDTHKRLESATKKLNLSARAYFRLIRVARTIADLENSSEITPEHILEAIRYRKIDY